MRRCIANIHDPDTTLNFDLKVKFIEFLTCLHVRPVTSVSPDIDIPYLAHGCIPIKEYVKYIHDPDTTLSFDLRVYRVYDMDLSSALSFFKNLFT